MRKIIVSSFITLDGVMQAPGGPGEDTSGGFQFGGWMAPYGDEVFNQFIQDQLKATDILLGRKTFEIFENYWPQRESDWPGINDVKKYVLSTARDNSDWKNSVFLKSIDEIKKLKAGPDSGQFGEKIRVWGSSILVQSLLKAGLIDEIDLNIFPVILGKGKRLFSEASLPSSCTLISSLTTPKGVIMSKYKISGEVVTGTVGT